MAHQITLPGCLSQPGPQHLSGIGNYYLPIHGESKTRHDSETRETGSVPNAIRLTFFTLFFSYFSFCFPPGFLQ
jgi:hypothetical protein